MSNHISWWTKGLPHTHNSQPDIHYPFYQTEVNLDRQRRVGGFNHTLIQVASGIKSSSPFLSTQPQTTYYTLWGRTWCLAELITEVCPEPAITRAQLTHTITTSVKQATLDGPQFELTRENKENVVKPQEMTDKQNNITFSDTVRVEAWLACQTTVMVQLKLTRNFGVNSEIQVINSQSCSQVLKNSSKKLCLGSVWGSVTRGGEFGGENGREVTNTVSKNVLTHHTSCHKVILATHTTTT